MGWRRGGLWLPPLLVLHVLLFPPLGVDGDAGSKVKVKFLRAPLPFSASSSASFRFEVTEGGNDTSCSDCTVTCKLDNSSLSDCEMGAVTYTGLPDGNHTLYVCVNGSIGVDCASYSWISDKTSPTASVSAASSFTNALNVPVRISFSEPCTGGGGFRCSNDVCNILVYGAGHVLPSTLKVLQPGLEYSLAVGINADTQYGRLIVVMDKNFCKDTAGNRFKRTSNSTLILHFDRRNVYMNLTTNIPKQLLQLNGDVRTVEATNMKNLKVYLSFSVPVLNSSEEILSALHASNGLLIPTNRNTLGNRRFGYLVRNMSDIAILTVTCDTASIISRQGTPISPSDPLTFLYDSQRPSVRVSTISSGRTRQDTIPVLVKFLKPVFEFNSSAISISGGSLLRFQEISKSVYTIEVHANSSIVSVEVPQNKTADVAGNKNLPSNHLQISRYSIPTLSSLFSLLTTVVLFLTSTFAVILTISTASLLSSDSFPRRPAYLVSEPSRNLMRIICHVQIYALSRWLPVTMPIEYYEFARGLQWTIPYLHLPWETAILNSYSERSSSPGAHTKLWDRNKLKNLLLSTMTNPTLDAETSFTGKPLTPAEYMSFFENQNMMPRAEYIVASQDSERWKYFARNMFWLAVIGGGLIILHIVVFCIIKFRRKLSEKLQKEYGALLFPRFEIFLILLALPCICMASATIIKGKSTGGIVVGIIILGVCTSFIISLLLFLSLGITMGKLLQYKEVHQEGQVFHWYQEIIRATLGPGKRGQWTWKSRQNSNNLTKLGPLFEDLRGPPKYMLTQISGGRTQGKHEDRIIASEDENEDAEAPFIQKLFGILRIYYTFLDSVKRVVLGVIAGAYSTSRPHRTPTIVILSITSFQLFFLLLKKPFIKKRVQLVEIITVTGEVGLFGACLALLERDFSGAGEKGVGYFMLAMFLAGFISQLINEWYSLYRQIVRMSSDGDSFFLGLKTALGGLLLICLPSKLLAELTEQSASTNGDGNSAPTEQAQTNSGPGERPWLRQLRELAKASFSREDGGAPADPSSSTQGRSVFWSGKRSRSSSVTSSSDYKAVKADTTAKSKGLYKDLEAIFSSK